MDQEIQVHIDKLLSFMKEEAYKGPNCSRA